MSATLRRVETEDGLGTVRPDGRLEIETPDGGLIIRTNWRRAASEDRGHNDNLAENLSSATLAQIADDILRGIQADELSRAEWLETLASAIDMLGLRLKKQGASGEDSAAPMEGMSRFDHPLLLQSAIRFQSDFVSEMLPADGPVKIRNDHTEAPPGMGHNGGPPMDTTETPQTSDDLASALEKDFNHYLTSTATEYYPDTTRMAFTIGLLGGGFKKIYDCPLRKRPVSESVAMDDLIVDHSTTDIQNAALVGRVTHRIKMRNVMLRRMIKSGIYRDIIVDDLADPRDNPDVLEMAVRRNTGINPFSSLPSDHPHIIYETSTGLDPSDIDDGPGGDYLPYKVTIEKDSRQILAIRRNWEPEDKMKMPRREYVRYSYIDGLGFYPIGLIHILGNTVRALTAAYREFLDAGMFANFPGFVYADVGGRQVTNEFRVPPGGGVPFQTGGKPLGEMIMPLPYKSPDAAFMQFIQHLEDYGKAISGEAAVPMTEGRANMPVGTMLAAIEQAIKPIKGVFKGLHRSQAEEFQILKARFKENPSALWKWNKKPSRQWEEEEFLQALEDCELVPMADPNTASQVQRIITAWAIVQLAQMAPMLFKLRDTALRFMRMIGVPDPEGILDEAEDIQAKMAAQSQQPAGDPALNAAKAREADARAQLAGAQIQKTLTDAQNSLAGFQNDAADRQAKAADRLVESQDRAADRAEHLQIAQLRARTDSMKTGADMVQGAVQHHADAVEAERQRMHDAMLAARQHQHEATQQQTEGLAP